MICFHCSIPVHKVLTPNRILILCLYRNKMKDFRFRKKCYHQKVNRQSGLSTPLRPTTQFIQYSPATTRGSRSPVGVSASQQLPGEPAEPKLQSAQQSSQAHMETQKNTSQPSRRDTCVHRFIGDLNPVVLFVGDGSTRLMRGRAHQRDVGVWLDRENEFIENGENAYHEELSSSSTRYQMSRQKRHSGRPGALLPPRQTQEALINIYFRRIHPVLPLVHEEDFQVQFRNGTVSPYLLQAICLVASKEGEAEPVLRLRDRAETMSPCRFSNLLYEDLCHAITMRLERQRMTLIQILALASLHASGPKSFEDASLFLAQAIHHAHTVGLHFLKCGPARHEKPLVTLFWCLWSLDRWIAAIHGRPLVIHDRDLGQQLTDVIDLFDSPFRVWLSLASIMGEVMVVYRPTLDAPVDENKPEIPRFEELIAKCQAEDISLDQMCQSPSYAFFLPGRSLNYPSVFRIGVSCNSSSRLTAMGPQGSTEVSRAVPTTGSSRISLSHPATDVQHQSVRAFTDSCLFHIPRVLNIL
ncbi:hypothetical protein BDV24DRAFT_155072 [Aspergillus arachidicola]|uniref:Xylanolytic transcriptional activator regulatory domain-containing protein n=1 Tax=Aspergillus arachidicola TaxID=656916 RepID=A0A5N6XUA9_9EURO|nr:hypothetical protein BDV24DRAFT_155072 [Aspergillus arachidicola]